MKDKGIGNTLSIFVFDSVKVSDGRKKNSDLVEFDRVAVFPVLVEFPIEILFKNIHTYARPPSVVSEFSINNEMHAY